MITPSSLQAINPALSSSAAFFLFNGIASSTRAGYESAQRSYRSFCRSTGVSPYPTSTPTLCNWVAHLAVSSCRPSSIRHALAGLRSFHTDVGLLDAPFDSPQLARVLRGIRRHFGRLERRRRLPITLPILASIIRAVQTLPFADFDRDLLCAAWSLAYVGGMRCGELTYEPGKFDPTFHISRSDFSDFGSYAVVRLPSSKTDPFRKGVNIVVPAAPEGAPVDPLALVRKLAASIRSPTAPLFSRLDIRAISRGHPPVASFPRSFFVDSLRRAISLCGYDASAYAGHSFRRGLATWAKLSARLQDEDIKLLGRWSSDAVKLYQETPTSHIASLAARTLLPARSGPAVVPTADCWWGDE